MQTHFKTSSTAQGVRYYAHVFNNPEMLGISLNALCRLTESHRPTPSPYRCQAHTATAGRNFPESQYNLQITY